MADKKNYILYTSSTDKILQKRLEELNRTDEEEVTKRLEHNRMVEEITNSVINALSKNIASIVTEQVSKLGKSTATSTSTNYSNLSPSSYVSDNVTYYGFDDDLTKGQVSADDTLPDIDEKLDLIIPYLDKLGMSFERTYNKEKGGYDLTLIDKNGKKYALQTKIQKQPKHVTTDNWYSLVDKYVDNRKKLKDIMGINLIPGMSGLQNLDLFLYDDDDKQDFSNYKVKSNIGFFLDKQNIPKSTLASKADVSRGTVLSNLDEANGLSLLNAYKISKVLGVPMEQLFVFTNDEDDDDTDILE